MLNYQRAASPDASIEHYILRIVVNGFHHLHHFNSHTLKSLVQAPDFLDEHKLLTAHLGTYGLLWVAIERCRKSKRSKSVQVVQWDIIM